MLDIRLLREDSARIVQNLKDRHVRIFDGLGPDDGSDWAERTVQRLVELDRDHLKAVQAQDDLRRAQNENAAAMKGKLAKEDRERLIAEGRALRDREKLLAAEADEAQRARDDVWVRVPNLTHPESPRGRTDDDHR